MIEILNFIVGLVFTVFAGFFAYMSSHLISEKKAGKTIPLPWERNSEEFGKFDKQGVAKYTEGDNT